MPLPKPTDSEDKDDFISRCMADEIMNEDFPDSGQRRAVCESQWKSQDKASVDLPFSVSADAIGETWSSGIGPDKPRKALKYPRILRYVASTPWAMEPSRLLDVLDVLKFKANGGQLSKEEIREYCGIQAAHSEQPRTGAVAVVPLHGIISHHIRQVQDISGPGGTSVEGFRTTLRAALGAREVGSVVIDIDSPGGSVEGVQELADEILSLRGDKPIIAVANAMAASAAFWIGSAADEFSVIPSGQVGSIGVFAAHEDISQLLEDEGIKITLVHAGKFKVEGNPFQALSEEAEAYIQERVDATFEKFVAAVANGRGVDVKTVENGFGQGRLVDADDALAAGMVDRIETLEQAITRMRGVRSKDSMRAEMDLRRQALAFT